MSSSIKNYANYTEVYIWRARDKDGYITTSSEGGRHESIPGLGRVGHASLQVFQENKSPVYMSLWPIPREKMIDDNRYAVLVPTFDLEVTDWEGTKPDVIVRLYHLHTKRMIDAYEKIKIRVESNKVLWDWRMVRDTDDLTSSACTVASCVSFVWTCLLVGGIYDVSTGYQKFWSKRGPSDNGLYELTRCNLGQTFFGLFDGFPWTNQFFTPYALSLRVSSATEAWEEDKEFTKYIMKSNRVATPKEREWDWRPSVTTTVTSVGFAALVLLNAKQ
jgi:hypothetical protein